MNTTKIRKGIIGAGATVLAAGALLMGGGVAANAAVANFAGTNTPSVVQSTQGASNVTLQWTVKNTGGAGAIQSNGGAGSGSIVFNAPTGTTFAANQTTVPTSYSSDGTTFGSNNLTLINCAGGGTTQLTCYYGTKNGGNVSGWPSNGSFRFSPVVNVSPGAATGGYSAQAQMLYTDANTPTQQYAINYGTLDVEIAQAPATPMIDPVIGGITGASALAAGGAIFLARRKNEAKA